MSNRATEHAGGKQSLLRCSSVWAALVVVILLTASIRIRLLDIPLERDEGEYAYGGQLILQQLPSDAPLHNIKPGIYLAYALIMAVFGTTHTGIHSGLLVINAATILVLFLLAKRLFGPATGVATAAFFAMLSLGQRVVGFAANREHFVILTALGGILLLLGAIDYQKWLPLLASAVLLGVTALMKANGAVFIVFAGAFLFFCELRRRPFNWKAFVAKGALFTWGVLLPLAGLCIILLWVGLFKMFWFWKLGPTMKYASAQPLLTGIRILKIWSVGIVGSAVLIWLLTVIGFIGLLWDKKTRKHSVFVMGFAFFSVLAFCPGFYFRPHYYILLLPAAALLAGIGVSFIAQQLLRVGPAVLRKFAPAILVLVVLFHSAYKQRGFLFQLSPAQVSRMTYGTNPFLESLEVARFIKEHSTKDDHIAVLGSEPQIYFYSNRHSATGHMYTYPLMAKHDFALEMQEEMIREIESAKPKFLVFVNVRTSWLTQIDSEELIFTWFQQYKRKYYDQIAVIEITGGEQSIYRWGGESAGHLPRSKDWLSVFRRKSEV
jgi:hypothetical protein